MTTTFEDIEIEPFPYPDYASDGLKAMIDLAHERIQESVVLFAFGFDGGQQDMITWLKNNGLLSKEGLEFAEEGAQKADPGTSVMSDDYEEKASVIRDKASHLRMQNESVKERSFNTFDTSNRAFRDVIDTADGLRNELGRKPGEHQLTRKPDGNLHLTSDEENRLLGRLLEAVDRVHDTIEDADSGMQRNAGDIRNMIPDLPANSYGPAPDAGLRTPWTPISSTAKFNGGNGTPNKVVELAQGELARGVHEYGSNNVRYRNGAEAPYDINGQPWCAAFSTWAWDNAGYHVTWSNPNYVPAIWNDAKSQGWAANISQAQPGDMIIFDWQGDGTPDHVGIVEAVDPNTGRIHTIEGNSSDQLRRNDYTMNNGALVGVVKPPVSQAPSARAS